VIGRARGGARLLVVTAVRAEQQAVLSGLSHQDGRVSVEVGGVGPAMAAASTARLLALAEAAGTPYAAVISAGIAGGLTAEPGAIVLGTRAIAADLGSASPDGFLSVDELGFGTSTVECDEAWVDGLRRELPIAVAGDILTVSTVTGTQARAAELKSRHPAAVAEGMEGYGVGIAAVLATLAFAEIRTISNPVGPRDRANWRIDEALAALTTAARALELTVRAVASGT
jgi:futalosine hydrolase